ncbi:orotidine-5'-phosphate decarboxylase [Candidatus Micrarchaeota archaeon]|nr:orotidine-5'-phosphate decarboxylase [Candidatus Micrarchaeota archaeon]MBU2477097.1 orotidine-5'-phosphate decarboxylase [Candidatus Micrarchaeota archaeon]
MKKIFLALDNLEKKEILELIKELKEEVMFKINDSFLKFGPELIEEIHELGGEVFLDLKFHDIPNTVGNYAKATAEKKVFMFNVHCLGGIEMMKKAKESAEQICKEKNLRKPLIVGVTILTSMDTQALKEELKVNLSVEEMVKHLALNAKKAGLDGVVCSPKEIELVKKACGKEFLCVTPGVRPEYSSTDDQKRTLTPKEAIQKGADFLVIGRPIIQAKKYDMTRKQAAEKILQDIFE